MHHRRAVLILVIVLGLLLLGRQGPLSAQVITTLTIGTPSQVVNDVSGPAAVNVPVSFDLSGVAVRTVTLQILYNSTQVSLATADVSLGSLVPGWTLTSNLTSTSNPSISKLIVSVRTNPGVIPLDSTSSPISGDILDLNFHVDQGFSGFSQITFLTPTASQQLITNTSGSDIANTTTFNTGGINAVPEPWSFALMALALPVLLVYGKRFGRRE